MTRFPALFLCTALLALPVTASALTLKKGETISSGGKVGKAGSGKILTREAKGIGQDFTFAATGQVAVNTDQRAALLGKEMLKDRCGRTFTLPPKVIDDVKAPDGYGLDDRFDAVGDFFRKASARCLGGVEMMCDDIHAHALEYATTSKIKSPRGTYQDTVYWNDTLTVSMRLTGPMASAVGVAWNVKDYPKDERQKVIAWLGQISNAFEHGFRDGSRYKASKDGFDALKAGHNHAAQSSIALMSVAALTGDRAGFITGIDQWFLTLDTMRSDGSLPIETRRGARAMFYHGRTLSALFAIAMRAKVQGVDLLGIERDKDIHRAVGSYLDVADDPDLVLKYAKRNKAPGPSKDYKVQDLGGAYNFSASGHGWVRLYIERFPNHENTRRLLNLDKRKSHIAASLAQSVAQQGKSTQWIAADTKCFYTEE